MPLIPQSKLVLRDDHDGEKGGVLDTKQKQLNLLEKVSESVNKEGGEGDGLAGDNEFSDDEDGIQRTSIPARRAGGNMSNLSGGAGGTAYNEFSTGRGGVKSKGRPGGASAKSKASYADKLFKSRGR